MTQLEQAKHNQDRCMKEYNSIKKKYGTGVRPSWVSTDLAILWDKIQRYDNTIKELEGCHGEIP